jgi:hypothetical protein
MGEETETRSGNKELFAGAHETGVVAVGRHQLGVRPLLYDAALLHDPDTVGALDGGQAMGDDDPQRLKKLGEGGGGGLPEGSLALMYSSGLESRAAHATHMLLT